jgi:hypothetical protein
METRKETEMKKLLRCVALAIVLLPFWTSSSQAVRFPYLTCETYCCWGYGTASSECSDDGFITTCGEWWQRRACP